MSKNRHILPVLVTIGATALGGCDDGKSADNDKKEVTAKKVDTKKVDTKKVDTKKVDTKKDPPKERLPKTTILHEDEPFPEVMGGAAVAVPFDPPPPEVGALGAAKPGADGAAAPAPAAAAPAAEAASPSAAAPAKADQRVAIALVHNHPPGEECTPLSDDEVSKAFADLEAAKK